MKEYVAHPTNREAVDPIMVQSALSNFVDRGVLVQEVVALADGRDLKTTRLNLADPLVQQVLGEVLASAVKRSV